MLKKNTEAFCVCVISTSSTKLSLDCVRLYWSLFILSQKPLIVPIIQNTFNEVLICIIFVIWLGTFVYIISLNLLKNVERGVSVLFSYQEINVVKIGIIKVILLEMSDPGFKTFLSILDVNFYLHLSCQPKLN